MTKASSTTTSSGSMIAATIAAIRISWRTANAGYPSTVKAN
jgi:hypothetical protein